MINENLNKSHEPPKVLVVIVVDLVVGLGVVELDVGLLRAGEVGGNEIKGLG